MGLFDISNTMNRQKIGKKGNKQSPEFASQIANAPNPNVGWDDTNNIRTKIKIRTKHFENIGMDAGCLEPTMIQRAYY